MKDSDWKIIEELKRYGSITQAADSLYMSQPTLTKRIQQIEKEWDIDIIRRNSKGISLTPAGEYLAIKAEELVRIFEEIPSHIEKIKKGTAGELKLGVPNSFGRFELPNLLQKYKQEYSDSSFQVITMLSSQVVREVESGKLDVGFIKGEIPVACSKVRIGREPLYIVGGRAFVVDELPSLPMIAYLKDPYTQSIIEKWWEDNFTFPPKIGFQVNHGDTCREMILNGLGYGMFFSENFFKDTGKLYIVPATDRKNRPIVRNSYFIYREDSMEVVKRNFIQFVLKEREKERE